MSVSNPPQADGDARLEFMFNCQRVGVVFLIVRHSHKYTYISIKFSEKVENKITHDSKR